MLCFFVCFDVREYNVSRLCKRTFHGVVYVVNTTKWLVLLTALMVMFYTYLFACIIQCFDIQLGKGKAPGL